MLQISLPDYERSDMTASIAIVDDHRIVLDGLKRLIEAADEWTASTFQNGADALAALEKGALRLDGGRFAHAGHERD